MAKSEIQEVTFIPYSGQANGSKKKCELLNSLARRHAALAGHQRARKRSCSLSALSVPVRTFLKSSPEASPVSATTSSSTASDTEDSFAQYEPAKLQHPSSEAGLSCTVAMIQPRVGQPRFLGEFSCRPLTDLDGVAIRYFLQHGPGQPPASKLGRDLTGFLPRWLALAEDLARRAVQHRPLLDSLVAYTAINMSNEHTGASMLAFYGQATSQNALRSVRQALTAPESLQGVTLAYAVLHLCKAAIARGQTEAAYCHLRFLIEETKSLDPQTEREHDLLTQIRGINIKYSLQAGRNPLSGARWSSLDEITKFLDNHAHCILQAPDATDVCYVKGPSTSRPVETDALRSAQQAPSQFSCMHDLHAAMTSGIAGDLQHIVDDYIDVIKLWSQLTAKPAISWLAKLQALTRLYECLELLCDAWDTLESKAAVSAYANMQLASGCERTNIKSLLSLDRPLVIAIELHLVMCLGTGHTMVLLGYRLRRILEARKGSIAFFTSQLTRAEAQACSTSLYLWILLIGMFATEGRSEYDFHWMQVEAHETIQALGISTEDEVFNRLNALWPTGYSMRDDLDSIVRSLILDQRTFKRPDGQHQPSQVADS